MGHVGLARTARTHALRAIALAWVALAGVIAATLAIPNGFFDDVVNVGAWVAIAIGMALATVIVAILPVQRLGDRLVGDLRAGEADGRLRNVAEEVSIAISEPPGRVLIHGSDIPNVGAIPASAGIVVLATAGAVDQLRRDELEALVAAQLAGMRDPWCRLATRAELVWTLTKWGGFATIVVAHPVAAAISTVMLLSPRSVEATRDLCADAAAVAATRHPAALADALRHLAPSASVTHLQALGTRWYLPLSPFLVLPKRTPSTTHRQVGGQPERAWTSADEVRTELDLRADRAVALAAGADPREFTGREFRRRWGRLGLDDESRGPD